MRLKWAIAANYVGAGAIVLAPLLALPWYLAALGAKQIGLISFVMTMQALLGLLDAGMSQALIREVSVRFGNEQCGSHSTASLLFGFERIYWFFAIFSGYALLLAAPIITTYWLNLDTTDKDLGRETVYGAAALFATQFPGSIYRSLLVGAQAQVKLNAVMLAGALIRHLGGVLVVNVWPVLSTYLIWHAGIAWLETLMRGKLAWSVLDVKRSQVGWQLQELQPTFAMVAGMSGATLLGALTAQIDKIILSRMVPIEQFGYYVVAATAATGTLQLIYPLIQAILPRAIQLRTNPTLLRNLSMNLMKMIGLVVGLAIVCFIAFGRLFLDIWLRNEQAAKAVYPLLAVLLAGTCLNAFYNVGYINWIIHEKTRRVLQVNLLSLALSVALIPIFVAWLGVIGATFGWVAINLIGFLLSLEWLKRC